MNLEFVEEMTVLIELANTGKAGAALLAVPIAAVENKRVDDT